MNFEQILFIVTLLYISQIMVFFYGISSPRDITTNRNRLFVSVVVAARNEEKDIGRCLESLLGQTYPADSYEIILIDDHSTDKTRDICLIYEERASNFHVFSPPGSDILRGKMNALAHGIEHSRGEIVLITDADCVVPPSWIEGTVRRYEPNVGVVGGMTLQRGETPFEGMQSLDWAFLLGVASAGVTLRNPLSTIGNNLSFRRKAYDDVGGYRKIRFSVTEDYALFQAIVRTRRWEYLYPIDPEIMVTSKPCATLTDLIRQKHRWGKGGLDMKATGFLIMVIGFLQHGTILASLILGAFTAGATALLVKSIGDYFFLQRILSRLGPTRQLRFFYWFQLYYSLYVITLPFLVFFGGKVVWKGRFY